MNKKILLLTDVQPSKNYSGAILSMQLCHFLLEEKLDLFCCCIKSKYINEKLDDELQSMIPTLILNKPIENGHDTGKYNDLISIIIYKVLSYINQNKIDIVWCPVQGETLLRVLDAIQKNSKVKVVIQVWDPIEWFLVEAKYTKEKTNEILRLFSKVVKKSDYIMTASEPMANLYYKKYDVPCLPIYLSFDSQNFTKHKKKSSDNFIILLSGQTYASKGIKSLIKALERIKWNYKGKNIIINYYGSNGDNDLFKNPHIVCKGFIPQKQLLEEETKANLLYCSYFFETSYYDKIIGEQSYPSKVISYIPAQVPILIHSNPNTSVYKQFNDYNAGYLLNSLDESDIVNKIKIIIDNQGSEKENKLIENANILFNNNFTKYKNKANLFKTLDIKYTKTKKIKVLEVNNVDLPGKRFNGYDIMEYLNNNTDKNVRQIVTYKTSNNNNVIKLYNDFEQQLEYDILDFESKYLSVHSCMSVSSPLLHEKDVYKNSDLVHYHLIHNTKLSLISLIQFCNEKPSIISIHDPWNFTGRCVHYGECDKYMTGCHNCENLGTLFPLKEDNCSELWKLKQLVYNNIDVDYLVHSKYMYNLFKGSPLLKDKRVHYIPLGINIDEFTNVTKEDARKRYKIAKDEIVIFHRAQKEFKGTNYLVEAMKKLKTNKKITIITCSEKGLLDSLKNVYTIIDLGNINTEELSYAYNACDFLLMPSIGESFGLMAIEAMSCSKPVIVFNNTALPEIVFSPECGIAVENKNSNKLMEAIKKFVENPEEIIKRGKLARKIVVENYDVKDFNKKINNLYDEVLSRKHNFNNSIFNNQIIDNESVIFTKYYLNTLTRHLLPPRSKNYNNMIYKIEEINKKKKYKIEFSDINVQLLINEYNNKLISNYHEKTNVIDIYLYSGIKILLNRIKLYRRIKRFNYLLLNDRSLLKETIKRKANKFFEIIKKSN